jgi:ABC-type transport system substrate-binding protein
MKKEYFLGIIVAVAVLAVAAYFLWPKPNFQVSGLSLSATTVHPGDLVALNVTVTNSGTGSGTYKVDISLDGSVVYSKEVTLNPGASQVVSLNLTTTSLSSGVHKVSVGSLSQSFWVIKALFADKRVREAFAYAFDYNTYIKEVLKGGAIQPNGPVPQGMFGYDPTIPKYTYNLTKAKELLQAVAKDYGFSPDNPITIKLYYNTGNAAREKSCLLLASAINNLNVGIKIEVVSLAWPQYLAMLRAKKLPIFFLGWAPDYIDPDDYLVPFLHSEKGTFPIRTGYKNPEVDRLVDLQSQEFDEAKRFQIISQIQRLVYEDVPYIWTDQPVGIHFERTWLSGWYYNPAFAGNYYATISKSKNATNPDVIYVETIGEPDYVDPAVDYETSGGEVLQNVYETLFWFNGSSATEVIPWLAENYSVSSDGLSYTIHLRKGIYFQDGTPFNATAVQYSLERAIIIADPDGPAWMLGPIKGAEALMEKIWAGNATQADVDAWKAQKPIEVLDTYTVRINLDRPYAPLPKVLAFTVASIVSPSYVEAHGGVQIGKHNDWMDKHAEAGTGPYILESWTPGVITLKRNPNYWGGPNGNIHPQVERVIIKEVDDPNTRLTDLLSGQADMAYIIRDMWPQLIDMNKWYANQTVVVLDQYKNDIRAVGPLPTFDIDFLGFNFNY